MSLSTALASLRQRFARVTSSVAFIPQIDGLRALALLLVLGHHVFAIYLESTHRLGTQSLPRDWGLIFNRSAWVAWGMHLTFGVQIFFVISGFVLAIPFARSCFQRVAPPSTRLYLLRRLIRIEPPYLISMTFLFIVLLIDPHRTLQSEYWFFRGMIHVFGYHYLASLVYLHALIYGQPSWINGVAWTLEIEIQFYLLMPVIAHLFRIQHHSVRQGILFALTLGATLFAQFGAQNPRLYLSLADHLGFFLAGVLLADLYLQPPRGFKIGPLAADLCALLSTAALIYCVHWQPAFRWVEPFFVASFFFGTFYGRVAGGLFKLPWLTVPGTMCYTMYLWHVYIIKLLIPVAVRHFPAMHDLGFDFAVQMLLMLPPLVLVSGVLYLLIEKPFIVLSHTATRRWRPVPAAAPVQVAA